MIKLLSISSALAITAGLALAVGGVWGIYFTYESVSRERIVTPPDASIPDTRVRGPLTLKAQADIIRAHVLRMTGGKTYSEMPSQVPQLDENGEPLRDSDGNLLLTANRDRQTWVTATALITALHLGILTYVFSGIVILLGLISVWTGILYGLLARRELRRQPSTEPQAEK